MIFFYRNIDKAARIKYNIPNFNGGYKTMQNKHLKLFVILFPLILALTSCQMEADYLERSPQLGQDSVSNTEGAEQTLKPPAGHKDSSPDEKLDLPQNLVPALVRVQFDPAYGSFYPVSGKPTQNPVNLELTTGYTIAPPQNVTPYKEGCNFKGWVKDYPYPGKTFAREDYWNFENDILTEGMSLYAHFQESDKPDQRPESTEPVSPPGSNGTSRVYSLHIEDVPKVTELGLSPNSQGLYALFAKGVTKEEGWYNSPQYMGNCWATSASQMIYWYQTRLNEFGKNSTVTQPDTILELRNWFADGHGGFSGWHIEWALEKYFAEFYPDRLADITTYRRDGYYFSRQTLSDILLKHLSRGDMCGLTAVNFDGGLHAMNIYGAQFNADGIVEIIYVTSSPTLDSAEKINAHQPRLYEYRYNGESRAGAPQWLASYDISKDGYTSTTQSSIRNIYGLDFLSVDKYQ